MFSNSAKVVEFAKTSNFIGWFFESLRALRPYFRIFEFSRISGGNKAASTSMACIGAVLKTPRIFLNPRF